MRLPCETPQPLPRSGLRLSLSFFLVFSVPSGSVLAQTPPSAPASLHSTSTLVLVPALVQTPDRQIVDSLIAADFELTDNGVPQKLTIESVQAEDHRPLSLVVLIQTGANADQHFGEYTHLDTMISAILGSSPGQIAVVNFDNIPEFESPFLSNVAEWKDAIDTPIPGNGGACVYDAIAHALDLLDQQPSGNHRAILLISQQRDDRSKTQVKDLIRRVGATNTAVYSLTFSTEKGIIKKDFAERPHLNPPIPGHDQNYFNLSAPLSLAIGAMRHNFAAEVASLSGGEPHSFSGQQDFDAALATLANHVHGGYTLSFRPTSNQPGLHTLKLRVVGHPELHIESRTSYWAEDSGSTDHAPRE
jgi:VWFA-related protein